MNFFIYYLLIYLAEALAWGQYAANVFQPKQDRKTCLFSLFAIYTALFLIFQLHIIWLNIVGFLLGNLVFIFLCYDSKLPTALFHAGVSTALMSTCELIAYPFMLQDTNDTHYFFKMILWAVFSKTLYVVSLIFLSRAVHEEKTRAENSDSIILSLICFPMVSSVIMFILYMVSTSYPISKEHGRLISIGAILLLFMNLLVIYVYIHSKKRNRIFTEMQLSLQKEHDLSEYYQNMLKQNENQRILIHDIKNHLHTIALLNMQNAREQVDDYILQLTQSPALAYSARICDNKLLNMILYQYQQLCNEKAINLHLDIRSCVIDFMEDNDITSLFCNLLDNAIESAENITGGGIELDIKKEASSPFTVITLVNSCRVSPFSKDGRRLVSHKKNPSRHGYGMKSVERIVSKYNGEMNTYFNSESAAFHTVIMLRNS